MEFRDVVRRRRMVRHFSPDPVDPLVVERIIAAGLRAPSAGYSQGYALLVLDSPVDLERLWAVHTAPQGSAGWSAEVRSGVLNAPVVLAVLTSKDAYLSRYAQPDKAWTDRDEARWPVPYWYVDAGCVALLMLLAAVDEGLGALLFGIVPSDIPRFRSSFDVPTSHDLVGCVAIGHESPRALRRDLSGRRREQSELVHRGRW
ncbi:MAG: nitroreductase family protein [Acidimicrobiales bacterium]